MRRSFEKYAGIISHLGNLSENDKVFLSEKFEQYPRVMQGFQLFSRTDPFERIRLASVVLNQQSRTGWLRFDIEEDPKDILSERWSNYSGPEYLIFQETSPVVETVLEHSAEAGDLYALIYKHIDTEIMRQWGNEIMKFHDFSEAIIGDFTPNDPISREDKSKLEGIATDLLTQSRHHGDLLALHIYNCLQIYEGTFVDFSPVKEMMLSEIAQQEKAGEIRPNQQTTVNLFKKIYDIDGLNIEQLRKQIKDIDSLQMAFRGTRIIHDHHFNISVSNARSEMTEFWNYIDKKLTTDPARHVFDELKYLYDNEPGMCSAKVIPLAMFLSKELYRGAGTRSHNVK